MFSRGQVAPGASSSRDIFFTTDDGILTKKGNIEKYGIVVKSPIEYAVK